MLEAGDQIPEARAWFGPREQVTLEEIVADGPALLSFYLFDWSNHSLGRTSGNLNR